MRILPFSIALSLLALTVACGDTYPPQVQVQVPAGICPGNLARVAPLVGRNIGEVRISPSQTHRIANPQTALTEDFNATRLNVFVDDKGWIQKFECW